MLKEVATEQQPEVSFSKLRLIQLDLKQRSILIVAEDYSATRLTLLAEGISYETFSAATTPVTQSISERSVEKLTSEAQPAMEKEPTVTLTGRLKTQPKEGRPDTKGNPTSWARLAVHEEGRED